MGDRHDYVALEWVKGEIAETLKQARQALEAFVENPQDVTRMRFCQTYVHQVLGTLQMVEFHGAALLAEEMEQLTGALIEGKAANHAEALEVLMQAILQLPVYLDRIQTARRDLPMVVLPLLNDLRAARGEKLLSETSLFAPDMSSRAPALTNETIATLSTAELPALLRKLRQMLQMALVGILRNQDVPTNLSYMARVLARLEALCKGSPLGALWPIAAGVVEGLADGSVNNSSSVRTLLRQVDKELKRLLDQGAAGFNQAAPEDLTKNLLFYIAKSTSQSPRIRSLKEQYRLDDALPETQVVEEERARLAGPDRDAMRSVVTALCEELVRVKDSLDLFVRSDRSRVSELQQLAAPLKQIADTLAVLGFAQPRKVIAEQIEVVNNLVKGLGEPNDAVLMDVAGALLYVEATLAGMVGPSQDTTEDSHLPTTDVAQIHQVVIKEARNGLEQAKDSIIEFIASQWNHEHLARVPELLTQARGGLAMIPLPRAAELLSACTRYIQEQLLARKAVPNWQSLDMLADAITSVEYYLERLSEDHGSQGDVILDVAEESLANLGYPPNTPLALADAKELVGQALPVAAPDDYLASEPTQTLPAEEQDAATVVESTEPVLSLADDLELQHEAEVSGETSLPELELVDFDFAELEVVDEPVSGGDELSASEVILGEELVAFDTLELEEPVVWDDAEIAALELPEVELPSAPIVVEAPAVDLDKPLSMADVMAAPVQAINPPAVDAPPSLLPPPADEEPVDEELLEVFIEEVGEVLETIGEFFPQWCADSDNKEALTEVRRAFHTLKGSGRMVRALIIGELAWSIENLLNRVLDRTIEPSAEVQQVAADVLALMPDLLEEFANKAQRQRDDVDHLAATAHALAKGQKVTSIAVVADAPVEAPLPEQSEEPSISTDEEPLDPQLLEIFRNEAEMHLDTLVAYLANCAQELPQPVSDDLQRALHTLKGSASMAGISPVAEIAAPLERLVKEFKTNLIQVDLAEAELLSDAEKLIRQGVEQLASQPLQALPGAAAFLERVQALHHDRLELAENNRLEDKGAKRDPQMISIFLAEGMDILLDAEDLLRRWREHPSQRQELNSLLDELTTLGRGAEMAELPQIEELCEALLDLYGAVDEGSLAVSEPFFNEVEQAHEALISMMDQVAAALEVTAAPERVAALRDLLNQALPPEAIGLLSDDGQSMQVLDLDELSAALDQSEETLPADTELNLELQPNDELLAEPVADELQLPGLDSEAADAILDPVAEVAEVAEPEAFVAAESTSEASSVQVLDTLDEEMVAIFLEEAVDILDSAGQSLERWLADPESKPSLSALQRDLHTLKGGARMAEIRPIGDLAHELESLYEGLVDGRYSYSPALSGLLQRSHDCLAQQLEQLQAREPMPQPEALIEAIRNFRQHGFAADAVAPEEIPAVIEEVIEAQPEVVLDLADEIAPEPLVEVEALELNPAEVEAPAPAEVEEPSLPEIEPVTLSEAVTPVAQAAAVDDRDPELVEIFLEEGFDIIDSASAALQRWMGNVDNSVELEALQRDLHTLKGGARMAEVREIGDLAHELEYLYEGLGQGSLKADDSLFSLLQTCHDSLFGMLEAVRDHQVVPSGDALIAAIKTLRTNPGQQLSVPTSVALTPHVEAVDSETEADILDIFLEEADDLLEAMDASMVRWDADRDQSASLEELQRVLHTLKGGARLAGQKRLGDLTHDLEQHLNDAQSSGLNWNESLFADTQSAIEGIRQTLDELRQRLTEVPLATVDAEEPVAAVQPMLQLATPIVAASQVPQQQAETKVLPFVRKAQEAALEIAARRAPQELVRVPAELLEELVNLAGETSIFRGRVEQQVSDFAFTLSEMEATIDRVRDQLRRLDTETQAQILSRIQAEAERAGYEEFDPLEMDRHSQLQQLSRSLFESASDLLDLKETLAARSRDAETLLLQQARVNSELQEGLMRTRMVPFDRLVPRLRRIVRQVSSELGKQVEFHIGNAEGEMDRTVLERIVAPLEHMLRNAVDHGVESVEARRAAGKPEHGTIRLDLGREGGDIVLTLSDDGAGIRLDAVRQKAIQRGLMDADSDLTDHEILQFILEAGFSTAEKITQISGRGVGMDVANSEVKQLGGSMSIASTPGSGTTFTVRLPFTVSVNRALMVLSGEDLYAIPLNTIEGIVRVSPYELEAYYAPDAPRFEYAGQAYELRYLGDLLNNGQHPKLVGQSLPLPVILVRSKEHVVAVQVDSLAGSREIVVKGLGPQFAGVPGISGATILGDGRVVVILDLLATIRAQHARQLPRQGRQAAQVAEAETGRPTLVMVVDDSVTVRKVTTRLLERNGMNVLTAKDGVDAIAQLQETKPDIMLLDIEMPRMDGFEVATLVRHDENLKDLPIIMITSRTGDKHRERAMSLGVNEYLGKPYQEALLLETIQGLVKQP
ncbi:Hpt domain-containing protein [Pseudomonas sp. TTU2014-080ASC]|uniref:Hpt domain-containing protein n=1 Tax=Pseudomonas sp. TTU2014-080ASC TaxID=1729724 RepID=UPI0007183A91|nr:Hpt domain-containing protein [Pseudomonas sp. TTU2014-080ASC]KRW61569.1 chemotaxis protein CheA [Pseudomonas sp. TTU2014-080ASC]